MRSEEQRLAVLARNSMEYSTFHAIPNIARTKRSSVKVMWILILIASSGICGFLVFKTINQFLGFEVFNQFNVVYEIPTEFPTVSICNANTFATNEALKFSADLIKESNLSLLPPMDENGGIMGPFWHYMSLKYWLQLRAKNPDISDKVKKTFGHSQNDFFILCLFKAQKCSSERLVWYYDTVYGNCFRFNSRISGVDGKQIDVLSTSQPGNVEGLQLFLYVGIPDSPLTFSMKSGAHITIHNSSIEPTPIEGIDVPTGLQTNIEISREFIYKLPRPYNECYDDLTDIGSYDSELYRMVIRSNQTYRQTICLRVCLQKWIIESCKCYDLTMPRIPKAKPCFTFGEMKCVQEIYFTFWNGSLKNRCGDSCPLECDSLNYNLMTSFADFPTDSFTKLLAQIPSFAKRFPNVTFDFIKKNFLLLNVYYGEMKYMRIEEQESMNWIDMISNIGGTMGLFLGISFLSFIEFIEFLIEAFCLICGSRKIQTKSKMKQESEKPKKNRDY